MQAPETISKIITFFDLSPLIRIVRSTPRREHLKPLFVFSLLVSSCVTSAQARAGLKTTAPSTTVPSAAAFQHQITNHLTTGKSLRGFFSAVHKRYGAAAAKPLREIVHNDKNSEEVRWASLFGLARIAGSASVPTIQSLMNNPSWMLRDAALKSAAAIGATQLGAAIAARLSDQALIVRTTAVDVIGHLRLTALAPQLVTALFDSQNYHRGKPLWIHEHILTVLSDLRYQPAIPKLVELLQTRDEPKFQRSVIRALESLTGKSFANKPLAQQVYLWKRNTLAESTF
jgi:hypothetical protein